VIHLQADKIEAAHYNRKETKEYKTNITANVKVFIMFSQPSRVHATAETSSPTQHHNNPYAIQKYQVYLMHL
jgi:hypothetical protein